MVPIARKNLLAEKTRFAVSIAGVAFAVFLIVLIQSLFLGFRSASGAVVDDLPFDLWLLQQGSYDIYHGGSLLSDQQAERVRLIDGVAGAQRVIARQVLLEANGHQRREYALAVDTLPEASAVDTTRESRMLPAPGEIALSGSITRQLSLSEGQTVTVGDKRLRVSGVSSQSGDFRSFSYLNYTDAVEAFGLEGSTNFIGVTLGRGEDPQRTAGAIRNELSGVEVLSAGEFAGRARSEIEAFTPILAVVLAIGFVVGVAVISLTIYTATIEKAREFGVLKALGASRWYLYRLVTAQSFTVGFLGFAVGVPLAFGSSRLIGSIVPEFVTLFRPEAIALVFGIVLLMSCASSFLPAHRIGRVDPAKVFRA